MSGEQQKRQLNVRVSDRTMELIDRAAYHLKRTKAQVIEDSICDYADKHDLGERYQLCVAKGMVILVRIERDLVEVVEMEQLNGTLPEAIAQKYKRRFNQEVPLVMEGE